MRLIICIFRALITMTLLGWFSSMSLEEKASSAVKKGLICLSCLTEQLDPSLKPLPHN